MSQEYLHCIREMGMTINDIIETNIYAIKSAFVDDETRKAMLSDFENKLEKQ